jgi:type IV pilus biogenesis protein PilP
MNSSRSPKRTRNTVSVLAALLLSSVAASAVAQEIAPPAPLQLPAATIDAPAPPAPGGAAAVRAGHDAQAVDTPSTEAVSTPAVPVGASLGEANERVKQMSSEADQLLDRLVDGALSNEADKTTVDEMNVSNMRIMQLEKKLEEAKLVAEYWETVSGKDHRADEKIKTLETEKTDMQAELTRLRADAAKSATANHRFVTDPDPVVAEITGAAGSVKAKILIPYMGQIIARTGDVLPNGQKVTSISAAGVKVLRADGTVVTLGFGTSVPSTRPPQPAGAGVTAVVSQ